MLEGRNQDLRGRFELRRGESTKRNNADSSHVVPPISFGKISRKSTKL